jgi:protein phosphatase
MEHETAYAVDRGLRRPNNEDRAVAFDLGWINNDPASLLVIADGMGGHHDGEVASQLAVSTVIRKMTKNCQNLGAGRSHNYWISEAVKSANQKIYSLNRTRDTEMGTTVVAALVVGNCAHIVNVGDSRAYHLSRQGIRQITTDHSLVQGLISAGMITPAEAKEHSLRNCITQALGTEEKVDSDMFSIELEADDFLLLCSDGLTNELDDSLIYDIVQAADSPQSACETLVDVANRLGGRDNISVVLTQMKAEKRSSINNAADLELMGVQ